MKMTYFQDTDTLYLEFNNNPIVETQEINENTLRHGYYSLTVAALFCVFLDYQILSPPERLQTFRLFGFQKVPDLGVIG